MGDWVHYKIKATEENVNLAEMLRDGGYGKIIIPADSEVNRPEHVVEKGESFPNAYISFVIDLSKFPVLEKMANDEIRETNPEKMMDCITIICSKDTLSYYNKWIPNEAILDEISKVLPDIVLSVEYDDEYYKHICWYEKAGKVTNKLGKEAVKNEEGYYAELGNISPKCVKELDYGYRISLPIGPEGDKWWSFVLPKENVIQETYTDGTSTTKGPAYAVLTEPTVKVRNGYGFQQMSSVEIVDKYYQSRSDYRNKMQENVYIPLTKAEKIIHRGSDEYGYKICVFNCDKAFSHNGQFSICISNYDIKRDGTFNLGSYGRCRRVRVENESGVKEEKEVRISELKEIINAPASDRVNPADLQQADTPQMEENEEMER